ncbi:MAG: hypothetical protein WCK41_10475 [Actinomycetes bacterium]
MLPESHDHLITLMVAMSEGDSSALFPFVDAFGSDLERMIRSQLRSYGRLDLVRDSDELSGLVISAALEILDRAGSWDPDGAPPWVWASRAIRAVVVNQIGHATVDVDDDRISDEPVDHEQPGGELNLDSMAESNSLFRLFRAAIAATVSPRDAEISEQYLIQQSLGDPSPSHTVAAEFGLSAANVRQIVCRTRKSILQLQARDERYGELGQSGWLAA